MTTIILQRFANREYRLTNQSLLSPQKKKGDKWQERQSEKYAQAVHNTYVLGKNLDEGFAASCNPNGVQLSAFGEVDARQALRSLDIINEFHLMQKVAYKGGWGHLSKPTKFTKNARHRLLEAGAIVDKFCGLNAYEITCTLPGSTSDSMRLLAEHTGWIMNELTRLIRKNKCKYWFYVWELQKRGALHLHLLVADPKRNMEDLAKKLESRWWQLLQSISAKAGRDAFARKTGGTWSKSPFRWQSHIAPIQKSVAAYFSKYAGKQLSSSSKNSSQRRVFCPSRWWGCSTEIKEQIKAHRQKWILNISNTTSLKIYKHLQTWLNDAAMIRRYEYEFQLGKTKNGTELGGGEVCINYYTTEGFARMQTWEKYVWEECLEIARRHGDADIDTQTWTDADMEAEYILRNRFADRPMAPPSPHSQPSPLSRKLSKSRGTQAEPSLDLRARLIEFLAGGMGSRPTDMGGTQTSPNADIDTQTWTQTSLFDVRRYEQL